MYFIEIKFASPEFDEYVRLRYSELLEPLGLDFDEDSVANEAELSSYGLFDKEFNMLGGLQLELKSGKIQQVVIAKPFQSKGMGKLLLEKAQNIAKSADLKQLSLNAHLQVLPFYEKCDFQKSGKVFMESGIEHQLMIKKL